MADEQTTTQATEGLPPEQGVSQAQEQTTQVAAPAQQAVSTVVEGGTAQPGREEGRPFERVAGRKLDKLEKGLATLIETLQKNQSPPSPTTTKAPLTTEEFFANPLAALNALLDERDQRIKGEIPKTLSEQARDQELKRSGQEALKMIETNTLVRKDPEGIDRIEDILRDPQYGLEEFALRNPVQAARLALEIYGVRHGNGSRQAGIPTKEQMGSTATAVRSGSQPTLKDEAVELQKQILANPELARSPEMIKKFQELKNRRIKELAA